MQNGERTQGSVPKSEAIRNEEPAVRDDGEAAFEIVELLFFAYRDFTSDPDAIRTRFWAKSASGGLTIAWSISSAADRA